MLKQVFMLLALALTTEAKRYENIVPLALIDDAEAQLEALRQTVLGSIFVAEDDLDNLQTNLQYSCTDNLSRSQISMEQEEQTVTDQINTIKDLAKAASVDITYCLGDRETFINNLLPVILGELGTCISGELNEGSKVVNSSKYLVDISINRVDALEFQLDLCDPTSTGCISPILQQIQIETEEIPQGIKVEVLRASDLFDDIEVSVDECSELKLSQYTSSANTILRDITQCVEALLGD